MQKIYLDVLFAFNFAVDYFLISLTLKIANIQTKEWHKLLSAVVGGVGACLVFTDFNPQLIRFITVFLSGIVAFGRQKPITYLKLYTLLCSITLAFGGGFYALAQYGYLIQSNGIGYMNISVKRFVLVFALLWFPIKLAFYIFTRKRVREIENAEIIISNKRYILNVLIDTGCSLSFTDNNIPILIISSGIAETHSGKFVIPFNTVSGSGTINGIFATGKIGDRHFERLIVADCGRKLSKNGEYDALVSWKTMIKV